MRKSTKRLMEVKRVNYKEMYLVFYFMCRKKHRRKSQKLTDMVTHRDRVEMRYEA